MDPFRYNFGTYLDYLGIFTSQRYFSDQNLIYETDAENLEQISYVMSKICNSLALMQDDCKIGNIYCLSRCLKLPYLYQVCLEYNLLSTVSECMTEDYNIAIDITSQQNLFSITKYILMGKK